MVTVTANQVTVTLDPSAPCRKKLRGRIVTVEQMAREALRLKRGNAARNVAPMSLRQIAERLGYRDKASVRQLLILADAEGYGQDAPPPMTPERVQAARQYGGDLSAFKSDPLIVAWEADLNTRGRGGEPLASGPRLVAAFRAVTTTLHMAPAQWLAGQSNDEITANAKSALEAFVGIYMGGKALVKYPRPPEHTSRRNVAYNYAKSIRSFLRAHGYSFPLGDRSVMSQAIDHIRGKYADIRMTPEQYAEGQDFLAARCGIDSDAFRWFTVGFESMARSRSLHAAEANWDVHTRDDGREIYIMKMYETKTKHINRGEFVKYIWGRRTQEALRHVAGGHVIAERNFDAAKKDVYRHLRATYLHLGLEGIGLENPKLPESGYFMVHPSHALRHCGAQFQLALTNFNYGYVAAQGWTATAELEKSYGRPPPEFTLQTISGVALP